MSRSEDGSGGPPAIIHKRILDVAESNPEASLEGIAETVTGASIDLVERVLEEYGDPGESSNGVSEEGDRLDSSDEHENGTGAHMSQGETTDEPAADPDDEESKDAGGVAGDETTQPDRSELSDKQVDALRRIRASPDATQRELAEEFDVTAATVSRWLNDIPGFAWEQRRSFASRTLNGTDETIEADSTEGAGRGDRETTEQVEGLAVSIEDLKRRVETLERETAESCEEDATIGLDADLLHKVIHACMASERITEEEELRILEGLIGADGGG
jgi:transcriptional regulator with XRE-family HTH domain